jgi:hypothetical protein
VLPRRACLTLCRSIQLLLLLARGDAKDLEILVLRHQLTVLRRRVPRPKLEPADRALSAAVSRALPRARWFCFLVTPRTLLRWHRRLVAGVWTSPPRGHGRPPPGEDPQALVAPGHREPTLGCQRIQGGPLRLGVRVSATAVRTTRRRRGLDPAPRPREHHLAGVPARTGRRDRRLRPASPSTRCGCGGRTCCSSSSWTPGRSTWPA